MTTQFGISTQMRNYKISHVAENYKQVKNTKRETIVLLQGQDFSYKGSYTYKNTHAHIHTTMT